MANESMLDNVKRNLELSCGNFREISTITGVPYSTLVKIHQGVIKNPGINHIQALYDHFNAVVRQKIAA